MLLDRLAERGVFVQGVGKIFDVYLGRGLAASVKTKDNADGMAKILEAMAAVPAGLIFANLVDFDQQYGHRNDVAGYAAALERFDGWLPSFESALGAGDLAILTADHGCDPTVPGTDHTREYVPLIVFGPAARRGVDLGLRASLADIGQTVAANFGASISHGVSFLKEII
jgi:phosphopentomutase